MKVWNEIIPFPNKVYHVKNVTGSKINVYKVSDVWFPLLSKACATTGRGDGRGARYLVADVIKSKNYNIKEHVKEKHPYYSA